MTQIDVLDHGFVRLVDSMPHEIGMGDQSILQAARVSYGDGTKQVSSDRGLIRYLLRHKHTTPFEMVVFKFHIKLPIFVARQSIRHRTGSYNEISARYSVLTDDFYIPEQENILAQSSDNKQGRAGLISQEKSQEIQRLIDQNNKNTYLLYQQLLGIDSNLNQIDEGIARELARMVLPVNIYTEWYYKVDLHNLFHYLKLRMDSHAQYEIRVYANAMYELIKPYAPFACEAFEDYILNGSNFSGLEKKALSKLIDNKTEEEIIEILKLVGISNKREIQDFLNKLKN